MLWLSHAIGWVVSGTEFVLVVIVTKFLELIELSVWNLQADGLAPKTKKTRTGSQTRTRQKESRILECTGLTR